MSKYNHQAFPKCVYGPKGLDDVLIINCAEERPDGYRDYDEVVYGVQNANDEAAAAKKEAKAAEKALRQEIFTYLDEHGVDYAKNLSTAKLEDLKVALDEHLGQQDQPNESE